MFETAGPPARPERVLVGLAALTVVLVGVWLLRETFTPALLGIVVVVIVHPVHAALTRRGAPSWVAIILVVAVGWLILVAITGLVVLALVEFARIVTDYLPDLDAAQAAAVGFLDSDGVDPGGLGDVIDPGALIGFAGSLTGGIVGIVTAFGFVLVYVLFGTVDAARFAATQARFHTSGLLAALRGWAGSVRRYYVINTVFGAVVAALDGIVLGLLGVPGVLVWVVLAFVTNYIPSIGFIIGLIPPVLLALLTNGPVTALIVLAAYCVINVLLQTFVQPRFVSGSVQLNLTLTFFSVVFWALILGPVGALLAIPATLFLRAVLLGTTPGARLGRWLSGESPAPDTGPGEG